LVDAHAFLSPHLGKSPNYAILLSFHPERPNPAFPTPLFSVVFLPSPFLCGTPTRCPFSLSLHIIRVDVLKSVYRILLAFLNLGSFPPLDIDSSTCGFVFFFAMKQRPFLWDVAMLLPFFCFQPPPFAPSTFAAPCLTLHPYFSVSLVFYRLFFLSRKQAEPSLGTRVDRRFAFWFWSLGDAQIPMLPYFGEVSGGFHRIKRESM